MAAAGYAVSLGDSWVLNEIPSAARQGIGSARTNVREFVRGLYTGPGSSPAKGAVFVIGMGQATTELSVYQARLQDWYEDEAFWKDMSAYVSAWSQELCGDVRNYAVPAATLAARNTALNDYLQHELALARAAPTSAEAAHSFLETAYSPLANAAWQYDSAFGWTNVRYDLMEDYVSAQTYALRSYAAPAALDHAGFAWSPKNLAAQTQADFNAQTAAILERLAAAIRDSSDSPEAACAEQWCGGELDGAWFNDRWQTFSTWKPSLLAFTTAPQTLTAGAASAALTLELRTASGFAYVTSLPLAVSLSSSSPSGLFSTGATGPWASTLKTTIASGSSSTSFYYKDTSVGTPALSAAAAGKASATQTETVTAGVVSSVVVTPSSATVPAGGSQTFVAVARDAPATSCPTLRSPGRPRPVRRGRSRLLPVRPPSSQLRRPAARGRS